jgi:hypothetical protein
MEVTKYVMRNETPQDEEGNEESQAEEEVKGKYCRPLLHISFLGTLYFLLDIKTDFCYPFLIY